MNKKEKLDLLDNKLADAFLRIMESGEYDRLPDLATLSNYLSKNNRIEEKPKSTVEDEIKKRVKEAEARRANDK
jgi:hypothetical protein